MPLLPRREDPHDRRRDRRGPADGHRTGSRRLTLSGRSRRRAAVVWLALFAAYAGTLAIRPSPHERYAPAEAHRLLTAASISDDLDLDLRNQYGSRTWREWHGAPLRPTSSVLAGRRIEAQGIGFPLLIAPAYAIGGATAVELELAALMALAFALAALLARRLVPEPWATRGALAVGLSPPALAGATSVAPAAAGAALLTGAALLALGVRDRPSLRSTFWAAALVAATPWLDVHLTLPAAVIALANARWLRRRQRGLAGFVALEVVLTSAVVFVSINDRLFGGFTPYASRLQHGAASGADSAGDYLGRLSRIAGALFDGDAGVVRWAPVTALALAGLWLLARSRRERLARAVPEQVDREVAAAFIGLIAAAGLASAVFLRPELGGDALVAPDVLAVLGCTTALVGWGWRHHPRWGALLAAATVALSAWYLAAG